MFVIVVEFEIEDASVEHFMVLMLANARTSLADEAGCRQFDVCVDPQSPAAVLLYEIYDNRAAFDLHLASPHFLVFDEAVRPMIRSKRVRSFALAGR